MSAWWCSLCREPVEEPLWSNSARPVPYHLHGRSMHSVTALDRQPDELPLSREVVVRGGGEYRTVGPEPRRRP